VCSCDFVAPPAFPGSESSGRGGGAEAGLLLGGRGAGAEAGLLWSGRGGGAGVGLLWGGRGGGAELWSGRGGGAGVGLLWGLGKRLANSVTPARTINLNQNN
jgi:hypothetical protein